ncbi:MAG: hypothetical protein K0S23_1598 [Fluviicola sp.]|jgi:hypothetical protein|uniref:hypothetical protein n=1 Tax=Fluviicola sp. TaxID=1917219 RepID=UPI00260D25D3|nr:hypothetical protein [Fluviicola sp.]MDF3027291.1 hypothetical protein [Fluviicola sp.]
MKYLFVILLCSVFDLTGNAQTVEFDIDTKENHWYPVPYIYNDGSFDLDFSKDAIYSYTSEGKLKEGPFKLDSEKKIDYKARILYTDNTLIDPKTDTRYVLFPEYYGLSNKEDQRISGCGSIMVEKLGTKGAEITHALFEDPDCDNFKKGAYFLGRIDSYITADGDPVFLVSMQTTSKSFTSPGKPEKGIKENCVKRITLHRETNRAEVSVHLLNKVPVSKEDDTKAFFIGSIDGKQYFAYNYTTPKTQLVNIDIWSVDEATSVESKEYSFQVEPPKGSSPSAGRMEVVSDPEKSGIAYYYALDLWEGNKRSAHYKLLEIHPGSEFKLTDLVIPYDIMTYGISPPKLNYYEAEEATHFFMVTPSGMFTVSYRENEDVEMHLERVNLATVSSAALFFDKRAAKLKEQYLKPIYENPGAMCKDCKILKRGEYRLTEHNQATFVVIEELVTCASCEAQHMRVRVFSEKLK